MREESCFPARRPPEIPWHSKPPATFLAVLREHIHHSPAHLSPPALYLNTESAQEVPLAELVVCSSPHSHPQALERRLGSRSDQQTRIQSMNKVMGAMNPGRSFRDPVYLWGCNWVKVSVIIMYSRVSFRWQLPDVFASESVFWNPLMKRNGFTGNYLKRMTLFYATRKYAWISSLLLISTHTHKNLIIINAQVNFQIFLSFPCHVSPELIRLRLFSPNNYHESGSHKFGNSWRISFWHHVA